MWRSTDTGPVVLWSSGDGVSSSDRAVFAAGSHAHANFGFTKAGLYAVTVRARGVLAATNEEVVGETGTYYFQVESAPQAWKDEFQGLVGQPLSGNVLSNDTDADGQSLKAMLVKGPTKGQLVLKEDGSFVYTPGPGAVGDSFEYKVVDPTGQGSVALVTVALAAAGPFVQGISEGHADLGLAYEEGGFHQHLHGEEADHEDKDHEDEEEHHEEDEHGDEEDHEHKEFDPAGTVIVVGPAALTAVPEGGSFGFLGASAGSPLWRIDQSAELQGVPYLGLSTEEIATGLFANDEVIWELVSVSGPGSFSMWRSTDAGPEVLWASGDGVTSQDRGMFAAGSHAHANFGFTKAGLYAVTVRARGVLAATNEEVVGETGTYYFQVESGTEVRGEIFEGLLGQPLRGNVLANEINPDGKLVVVSLVKAPAHGTLVLNEDGSFVYTPKNASLGYDWFDYSVAIHAGPEFPADLGTFQVARAGLDFFGAGPFETKIETGHADLGLAYEEGDLYQHIHGEQEHHEDESTEPGTDEDHGDEDDHDHAELEPYETLIVLGDEAKTTIPTGSAFSFLGGPAGAPLWRIDQTTPKEGVPFLGLSTEEIPLGVFHDNKVAWQLVSVSGPGVFAMWRSTDTGPEVLWSTQDGINRLDLVELTAGSHAHVNFGFSQPGRYKVVLEPRGTLTEDGQTVIGEEVAFHFQVGSDARPLSQPKNTVATVQSPLPVVKVLDSNGSSRPFVVFDPGYRGGIKALSASMTGWTGNSENDILAVAGLNGQGHVKLINGSTGETRLSFLAFPGFLGRSDIAAGDFNNDGFTDFAIAAGPGGGSHIKVYSGNPEDGLVGGAPKVLASFFAYSPRFRGGATLAAGDFNRDGAIDLATLAGPGGASHVRIFSGLAMTSGKANWQNGGVLSSFFATGNGSPHQGISMTAGDLNADGRAELIFGNAPGTSSLVWVLQLGSRVTNPDLLFVQNRVSFSPYGPAFQGGTRVSVRTNPGTGQEELITAPGRGGGPVLKGWTLTPTNQIDLLFSRLEGDPLDREGILLG